MTVVSWWRILYCYVHHLRNFSTDNGIFPLRELPGDIISEIQDHSYPMISTKFGEEMQVDSVCLSQACAQYIGRPGTKNERYISPCPQNPGWSSHKRRCVQPQLQINLKLPIQCQSLADPAFSLHVHPSAKWLTYRLWGFQGYLSYWGWILAVLHSRLGYGGHGRHPQQLLSHLTLLFSSTSDHIELNYPEQYTKPVIHHECKRPFSKMELSIRISFSYCQCDMQALE